MSHTICLHGALGSAAQFRPLLASIGQAQNWHTPNLPGHGGCASSEPFSMSLFAASVLDFMDENGIGQADLFGYSMGGYVALWLAWKRPDRVGRVVTYGTKLDWTPLVAAGMVRMFDADKIEAKAPALAESLAAAHGAENWKPLCQKTAGFLLDLGNGAGLPPHAFGEIKCPVTVGWGDQDTVVTREESEAAAAQIPQGRFEALPGGKHLLEQVPLTDLRGYLSKCNLSV